MSARRTTRSAALALVAVLSSTAAARAQTPPAPATASAAVAAFSIAWTVVVDSPLVAPPSSLGGRVFIPLRAGRLIAISREDGRELWRAQVLARHAVAADQGRAFVVTADALLALDATTGTVLWQMPMKGSIAAPVARGGWVLVGLDTGDLRAIRAADGYLVWHAALGAPLKAGPAMDGDRAYVTLADDSLIALDIVTGNVVWRKKLAAPGGSITAAGDRLFVGCRDNFFYSLEARDGHQRWRWRTGADIPFGAVFDSSRVYFVSLDNLLRALDFNSGTLQWRQPLDTRPIAAPLLAGKQVMVAGLGAELLVFNVAEGVLAAKWTAPAELSVAPLLFSPTDGTFLRAVVVTGGAAGDWRLYGVSPIIEPLPRPLTEIPGQRQPPDGLPTPHESRPPGE